MRKPHGQTILVVRDDPFIPADALLFEHLTPDARIVTYKYPMPGWTPVRRHEKVYLYELPRKPSAP